MNGSLKFEHLKLLFTEFSVFIFEFINTTCRINKFRFTSVKRMRSSRNLHFVYRILNAINGNGFFSFYCRFCNKYIIIRHVFKSYKSIIFWVNSFSHVVNLCFARVCFDAFVFQKGINIPMLLLILFKFWFAKIKLLFKITTLIKGFYLNGKLSGK